MTKNPLAPQMGLLTGIRFIGIDQTEQSELHRMEQIAFRPKPFDFGRVTLVVDFDFGRDAAVSSDILSDFGSIFVGKNICSILV